MNQGFALYNYIKKEVKNKYITRLCFIIITDIIHRYEKLTAARLKKNPKRNDMNLNPSPSDILLEFDDQGNLLVKIPKYFELYPGFIRRITRKSVGKWFIECKIQGEVIV